MRLITVLLPYREGQDANVAQARLLEVPGWVVVELTSGQTRQLAAFRAGAQPGTTARVGEVTLTGDVFAGAWDLNGTPRAVMQVKADVAAEHAP